MSAGSARSPYALAIFDLDGTLIDSAPAIVAHLARAFEAVAPSVSLPPLRPFIGPPVARMIPAIAPDLDAHAQARVLAAFRASYDGSGWQETHLLPGARDALAALTEAGVRCALATYKPWAPTTRILDHLGIAAVFEAVRCVDGPAARYDDKRDMLRSIVEAGIVPSSGVVYIGDTPADADAAARAGLDFLGFEPEPGVFQAGVPLRRTLLEVAAAILRGTA